MTRHQIAVLMAMCQRETDHWREQDAESLKWHDLFDLCPDCFTTESSFPLLPPAHHALICLEGLGWIFPCGVYRDPKGQKHRAWITRWHPQVLPAYMDDDPTADEFMELLFMKPTICAGQLTPF